MNFKEEKKEEQTSLAMDRNNVYSTITGFISAAIPLNNKLKDKTDEELEALYPKKHLGAKAVREWLIANAIDVKTKLNELKALLEHDDNDEE